METTEMVLYGLAGIGVLALIWFVFLAPRMKGSGGFMGTTQGGVGGDNIQAQDSAKVQTKVGGDANIK